MTDDVTVGAFEEQVMLAVMHAGEEAFGMNVRREIEERTGRDVAIGAVYATLDRLESKGLVRSSRPRSFGGSRRVLRSRPRADVRWRRLVPHASGSGTGSTCGRPRGLSRDRPG